MNKSFFVIALISWAAMSLSAIAANTITAITVNVNSTTQATVKYTTSTAVASKVKYGVTSSYGKSVTASAKVTAHSLVITGLKASTTYHYQIVAGAVVSPDATFVTLAKASPSPSPSPSVKPSPSAAPSPSPSPSASPSSKPSSTPSAAPSATPVASSGLIQIPFSSYCLNVVNGSDSVAAQIEQYTCSSSNPSEAFVLKTVSSGLYNIVSGNSGLCLDLQDDSMSNDTLVIQNTCSASASQQFELQAGSVSGTNQIKNIASGYCMNVVNASTANDALVEVYTCTTTLSENFVIPVGSIVAAPSPSPTATPTPVPSASPSASPSSSPSPSPSPTPSAISGLIQLPFSGYCLNVVNGSKSSSAETEQYTCSSSNQSENFTLKSVSSGVYNIVNNNSGLCLDLEGGSTANDTQVIQNTCSASSQSQQFQALAGVIAGSSQLKNIASGYCMNVVNASSANDALIEVYTCTSVSSEDFVLPSGAVVSPTPSASPSSSPTSGPSPSPSPTSTSSGTPSLQNASEWPATFTPYSSTSFWNRPVSSSPTMISNSPAIVSTAYQDGDVADSESLYMAEWGAGYDNSHPVFFATASDPLVNINCTMYCGSSGSGIGNTPTQIHIPAKARPGDGGDSHFAIIQPDGTEVDTWGTQPHTTTPSLPDWTNGATLTANTIMVCSNFYSGNGGNSTGAATVGDGCLGGGTVTEAELVAGNIPHALFGLTPCYATNSYVYPALQNGDEFCSGGNGIPNGGHVWIDLDDSQINALPVTSFEKTLLRAMHDYGVYVLDSGGNAGDHANGLIHLSNIFESQAEFIPFGITPPLVTWAQQQGGWNPIAISPSSSSFYSATRYSFSDNWAPLSSVGGWASHIHVLDPCVAQGTCQ